LAANLAGLYTEIELGGHAEDQNDADEENKQAVEELAKIKLAQTIKGACDPSTAEMLLSVLQKKPASFVTDMFNILQEDSAKKMQKKQKAVEKKAVQMPILPVVPPIVAPVPVVPIVAPPVTEKVAESKDAPVPIHVSRHNEAYEAYSAARDSSAETSFDLLKVKKASRNSELVDFDGFDDDADLNNYLARTSIDESR